MTIPGCAACGRQELPDWPPAHRAVMAAVVRRCIGNGGAAWGAFGRDSGALVGLCALDGQLPHPPSPWIEPCGGTSLCKSYLAGAGCAGCADRRSAHGSPPEPVLRCSEWIGSNQRPIPRGPRAASQ